MSELQAVMLNGTRLNVWCVEFGSNIDAQIFAKIYHQEMKLVLESADT